MTNPPDLKHTQDEEAARKYSDGRMEKFTAQSIRILAGSQSFTTEQLGTIFGVSLSTVSNQAFLAGIAHERARTEGLVKILEELMDCPYTLDEASIPKAGIDKNPDQVVGVISCGLTRIKRARAALAKYREGG